MPFRPRSKPNCARYCSIRQFASRELALPDNGSFRSYADLGRPYVLWNVFATPEFSLEPVTSCFPIAGCVSYRGYFGEADAQAAGARAARSAATTSMSAACRPTRPWAGSTIRS